VPAAEITRAETRERARLLRVRSYDVGLDFTRRAAAFGSVSLIRFDCAEPGAISHADLVADAVREITLNGTPLDPAVAWADGRIALPGLAAHNELRVVADCAYTGSGTGMHRSDSAAGDQTWIYGKLAQAYARTAYACFDQPDLKAEFTFRVTAPAAWTVLSNQPAAGPPAPDGNGVATWEFLRTARLPTFTTTVVAGDYHVVSASHTTPGGQVIPLELACRTALAPHLDATAMLELAGRGLDFYTGLLGTRYPYGKYGQVFVPELSCLASEDAGCVLFSERLLFRSRVTAAMVDLRSDVLLHEMAHMWFGDLATEQWWDDLWLSESFANFWGCYARSRLGVSGAWATFSVSEKIPGFERDRLPSAHPVASDAATLSEAIANFDGISYAKGAAVLRQLAAYVGEEAFFAGLRAYLAKHSYANARRADLVTAMAVSSGKDVAAWSAAWLETAGPSTLRCVFQTGADGTFTGFAVAQQGDVLRPHHIAIGLYCRAGSTLTRIRRLAVNVTGPRTPVPELLGVARPDLILLNDDDAGYVIVRLDPRSLRTVLASVGELPDALARAVCWSTVIDMVRQAELPLSAFVAMLADGMGSEQSVPVLQALHAHARQIITRFADPRSAADVLRRLGDGAARLLHTAEPGSDHQLSWAQLLSWTAASAGQLDLVAGLLDGTTAVPGLRVDAGLRWALLLRLAACGRAGDADIEAELATDATDAGRQNAAACRAAIPDAEHKQAAWRLLTGGQAGPETLAAAARGFIQPEHARLLGPYAGRYLAQIPDIWRTHSGHQRVLLGELLMPYPAASQEFLARIDEFLAARPPHDPDLTRMIDDHRDTVERVLRSRAQGATVPGRAN
jgi:aminopeptidase N